jgi:methionyl aminopeptidase
LIHLYTERDIEILREGGKILAFILNYLVKETREGITGIYLNKKASDLIKEAGASPSFLNYRKFPAALCISVNDELVHGIPKNRPIKKGDLVSLDLGIKWKGLCLDKATTFVVGIPDKEKERFLETVKKSLDYGITKAKIGHHLGEISAIIQKTIQDGGYGLVTALTGHGVGKKIHEEPVIPNFGKPTDGPILKQGMVLAIEPMATMGSGEVKCEKDGFTISSKDGSLSCHFEETIAVTKNGPKILTRI